MNKCCKNTIKQVIKDIERINKYEFKLEKNGFVRTLDYKEELKEVIKKLIESLGDK